MKSKIIAQYSDWAMWRGQPGGCGYYRIVQPFRYLKYDYDVDIYGQDIDTSETLDVRDRMLEATDIYYTAHIDNEEVLEMLKAQRKDYKFKMITEIDDDYLNLDPLNPVRAIDGYAEKMQSNIDCMKMSDALVVTTENLKELYKDYNENIFVCPNQIDPDDWRDLPESKRKKDGIRIGWTGGTSHESDLELLVEPLKQILRKHPSVTVVLCGYKSICFDELPQDRIEFYSGTNGYFQYPTFLNLLNIDIGLAPLRDTKFNRAKSNIKWMEYSMTKTPVIASPVEPYKCIEDHVDGIYANSTKEWVDAIEELIASEKKRKKLWMNARNKILANYNIKKNYKLWHEPINYLLNKKNVKESKRNTTRVKRTK